MKPTHSHVAALLLTAAIATGAIAATPEKAKPAAAAKTETKPAAPVLTPEQQAAEKTSALFYTICAESMGSEKEFDKRMKALADAKTFVKLKPEDVKGMNADEAKNAWGTKGLFKAEKPLAVAYNAAQNVCSMHVEDVPSNQLRHAFQADLKKLLDKSKGTVKVYKPKTNGKVNIYAADIVAGGKTMQLGIAISKEGESLLTFRM